MANVAQYPGFLENKDTFELSSDFPNFTTATDGWSSLATGTATVALSATIACGAVVVTSGAAANQDAMLRSTNPLFLPAANKPCYARALVNLTEAATNAANFFFGFASSAAADLLVSAGGGPRTTGTLFGIYKIDGGTVWRCVTRNGSTSTDTISVVSNNMTAALYQSLEIYIEEFTTTACAVTFKVNGQYLRDTTFSNLPIRHTVLYSGLTIANFVPAYLKAGAGGTSEVANVDYASACMVRQIENT